MAKIRNEFLIYDPNVASLTNTSYASNSRKFYWDASKYTSPTIYLEVYWKMDDAGNTGYLQLSNETDTSIISCRIYQEAL
jgi:hypothetical protein